jgi:aspartate 1-decarboxylase
MFITMLKSKIHRARVTEANLYYEGSITIDGKLMDASGILEHEKVEVLNINTGGRLETYAIRGKDGSGVVCMNGPAARGASVGDEIIILAYAAVDAAVAGGLAPVVIKVDAANKIVHENSR